MNNNFLKGTFYLTAGSLISKILGFIYIMPFTLLVGTSGYALYKYAYGPYTIMLSVSTLGLPLAVSKYVAKYNSIGNYQAGKDLLKSGLLLMLITGFICFILLFTFAPFLASLVTSTHDNTGNVHSDVVFVIRSVSFALIVVPPMSLLRGFYQGNQNMGPSALSTVIEQVFRIIFILLGSFITLKVFHGSIKQAVGIGTFGAFIGGLAGLIVLLIGLFKRKQAFAQTSHKLIKVAQIPTTMMFKELITYAIPFVIVGLAFPIYQNIDTFSINWLFGLIGYSQGKAEEVNSVIGLAQILVLVPVSLSTAFGMSLIPVITSSFIKGDESDLILKIKKAFLLVMFIILPASVGLCLLSTPLYTMLFGVENNPILGGKILSWYAPMAILFSLFTISSAILQGLNKQGHAILGMSVGVIAKIIFNYILIRKFHEIGPVLATYIGYFISVFYNIFVIKNTIKLPVLSLTKSLIPISFLVLLMSFGIEIIRWFFIPFFHVNEYSGAVVTSIICIISGLLFYIIISSKVGILKLIFAN